MTDQQDAGTVPAAETAAGTGAQTSAGAQTSPDAQTAADAEAALRSELAEMEDRWRRAMAELENQRKRIARDMEQRRGDERARAASQWLPVLDNLDLALQHAEADPGAIVEGVRAVRDQALAVLSGQGYPRRDDDAGTAFDPALHEAVAAVPDAEHAGQVLQVVRPG